jgi:hypothetical protein
MNAWINSLDGVQFVCLMVGGPAAIVAVFASMMAIALGGFRWRA